MNTLTWHGHSAFAINTPHLSILIDPWFDGNPKAKATAETIAADLVLVTHDHGDHVGQAVDICQRTGATLGCIVELAAKLKAQGLPDSQVLNGIGFNIGGTVTHKGVSVTMTQATHSCESGVPVGFIIRLDDGYTIYHSGDTGLFSSMALWGKLYRIDLALLPIGGVFTMDAAQAAMATMMLRAKRVVPMHWGTFPALAQNLDAFRKELDKLELGNALMPVEVGVPVGLVG
jgi:L-ascorbate metabolism protein UlaG (beta-lactamase superfamily)